jgi:nicotinate-nucleotide pyrophosphorylase (carboxylating)
MDLTPPDNTLVEHIIAQALVEDIGQGDITSQLLIPKGATAKMDFNAREDLVVCGGFIPAMVYKKLGANIQVNTLLEEGAQVTSGATIATATGSAQLLLTGERVTLNLMQRMCGIAKLTSQFTAAVAGTKAKILDTRKTMPGLRILDKYAVRAGGGFNHRMRLDDMVLIKDNHIAVCGSITNAVQKVRAESKLPIVVECDTLAQVEEAIAAKPDRIMLDNMSIADIKKAVAMSGGNVPLEVSGGVSLESVRAIAQTGVDYISVGKLTHSAPAADIGADITLKP